MTLLHGVTYDRELQMRVTEIHWKIVIQRERGRCNNQCWNGWNHLSTMYLCSASLSEGDGMSSWIARGRKDFLWRSVVHLVPDGVWRCSCASPAHCEEVESHCPWCILLSELIDSPGIDGTTPAAPAHDGKENCSVYHRLPHPSPGRRQV